MGEWSVTMFFLTGMAVAVGGISLSRCLFRSYLSPLGLYFGLWGSGLALYGLDFVGYVPITDHSFLLVMASLLCFCWGALSAVALQHVVNQGTCASYVSRPSVVSMARLNTLLVVTSLLSFIGAAATMASLLRQVPLPLLMSQPWLVRQQFLGFGTGTLRWAAWLINLNYPALILSGIAFALTRRFGLWNFAPLATQIGFSFVVMGRYPAITAALIFLGSMSAAQRARLEPDGVVQICSKLRQAVGIIMVVLSVLGLALQVAALRTGAGVSGALRSVYVYASGEFPALSVYLQSPDPNRPTYGFSTFLGLVHDLDKLGIINKQSSFFNEIKLYKDGINIPFSYNVFTYLRDLFDDFGSLGMCLGPLALGFTSSLLFLILKARPFNTTIFLLYVYLFSFIGLSLWLSLTSNRQYYWGFLVAFPLMRLILIKPRLRMDSGGRIA